MTERWRAMLQQMDTVDPSGDPWARAVARSAENPPMEVPSGDLPHRILAGTIALLVAAAGIGGAFLVLRRVSPSIPGGTLATYRDPTGAWEITYPERFEQGELPSVPSRVTYRGIWIANFGPPEFMQANPIPLRLPDDGILIEIYRQEGGLAYIPHEPDTEFPVSLQDLRAVWTDHLGPRPMTEVVANGQPYTIEVRMGPEAGEADREAAAAVVSSLRFLPLEEGSVTGQHTPFYVLGRTESYPVGSVTRFDESSLPPSEAVRALPFYLVHVPEGFYALAWSDDRQGGYKECDVWYQPESGEFSCSNGARWALDGSVIAKPGPEFPDDPLAVPLVRLSLDGHVLVSPNVMSSDTSLDLELTAPRDPATDEGGESLSEMA